MNPITVLFYFGAIHYQRHDPIWCECVWSRYKLGPLSGGNNPLPHVDTEGHKHRSCRLGMWNKLVNGIILCGWSKWATMKNIVNLITTRFVCSFTFKCTRVYVVTRIVVVTLCIESSLSWVGVSVRSMGIWKAVVTNYRGFFCCCWNGCGWMVLLFPTREFVMP